MLVECADLQEWSGACGVGCMDGIYTTAWDTASYAHNNYVPMEFCLGYFDAEKAPDSDQVQTFARIDRYPTLRLEAVTL